MNQLCPFCWTELQRSTRAVSNGLRERSIPLLECPHCAAAGTSNLIHSHHAFRNAVLRMQKVISDMEDDRRYTAVTDYAEMLRNALGTGLNT